MLVSLIAISQSPNCSLLKLRNLLTLNFAFFSLFAWASNVYAYQAYSLKQPQVS